MTLTLGAVALSLAISLISPAIASAQSCYPPPCTPAPLLSDPAARGSQRIVIQSSPGRVDRRGVLSRTGSSFTLPLLAAAAGLTILGGSLLILVWRPKPSRPAVAVVN